MRKARSKTVPLEIDLPTREKNKEHDLKIVLLGAR